MSGIAGELRFDQKPSDQTITRTMCDALVHRGHDNEGYHTKGSVSLGIRYRATTDLGKESWPLSNEDGTIHLVLDGRICDLPSLRVELEQRRHEFHSGTGLEVMVHAYEEWGTKSLEKLNGAFAFSLWDESKGLLWLVRDHFGIRPLYYHCGGDFLAFASDMKPLVRRPDVSAEPNHRAIYRYLQSGQVGAGEETFFVGITRLLPASYLLVYSNGGMEKQRYWKPVISKKANSRISNRTIGKTRNLFLDAVRQQLNNDLQADVSLSGGIDSSSVVCVMRKIRPSGFRIRTFSVSFPGEPIDETEYASVVSNAIGAENYVVRLTPDDLWRDLRTLVRCQEEPLGMSFAYAQWRLMKCASEHGARVLYEGHGGDELLCGYPRYFFYYFMSLIKQRRFHRLLVEAILSRDITKDEAKDLIRRYLPALGPFLTSSIASIIKEKDRVSRQHFASDRTRELFQVPATDLAARLEIDTALESLPVALSYVDRNSASHGIEVRMPFLEKMFVEHCTSLPLDQKIRDGWTKHAFRLAMKDILPEQIRVRRTKVGFQLPVKRWIENELRQRLSNFFSDPNLRGTRYYGRRTPMNILSKSRLTASDARLVWRMLNVELWCQEFF